MAKRSISQENSLSDSGSGISEIDACRAVYLALSGLNSAAQLRVLRYSAEMLGVKFGESTASSAPSSGSQDASAPVEATLRESSSIASDTKIPDEEEGINSVALKWMKRSDLESKSLQKLFSLGIDEIDLVARSVPGKNKSERMKSVLLLKGVAAYLSTGVPRVTHEQLKEACLHYDAYDGTNFASYLKKFASEASGSKTGGYTLTPRGLTSATELLKGMLGSKS